MYCKKCGKKLEAHEKFCSVCGEAVDETDEIRADNKQWEYIRIKPDNQRRQADESDKFDKIRTTNQPTKALVIEGIGILFFVYLLIINGSNEYSTQLWIQEHGAGVFFIGLIFVVVSYFMLKKYKKNHELYGIGYVGYIVSCIAAVLMIVLLIMVAILIIPVIGAEKFSM